MKLTVSLCVKGKHKPKRRSASYRSEVVLIEHVVVLTLELVYIVLTLELVVQGKLHQG